MAKLKLCAGEAAELRLSRSVPHGHHDAQQSAANVTAVVLLMNFKHSVAHTNLKKRDNKLIRFALTQTIVHVPICG